MPRPSSKLLTPPEWKVMNIVWRKKACAARDVYLLAGDLYHWAPNTVRTHLNRLVNKGFLNATLIGNSYLYRPKKSLAQSLFQVADELLDRALGGLAGPLLAYMVKKVDLTPEDIHELRSMLDQYEKEDPPKRE